MSIATDILSLRQNQSSSVETLMAKIEWLKAAEEEAHISSRSFGVREAADLVLLNVATHAADRGSIWNSMVTNRLADDR